MTTSVHHPTHFFFLSGAVWCGAIYPAPEKAKRSSISCPFVSPQAIRTLVLCTCIIGFCSCRAALATPSPSSSFPHHHRTSNDSERGLKAALNTASGLGRRFQDAQGQDRFVPRLPPTSIPSPLLLLDPPPTGSVMGSPCQPSSAR